MVLEIEQNVELDLLLCKALEPWVIRRKYSPGPLQIPAPVQLANQP
jgi:hypothetical protein